MALRDVSPERTGWRGEQWLSAQHRLWGVDRPACDIDFLLIEYDNGVPVALVDYKCRFPTLLGGSANYKAQRILADNSNIPFFLVFYSPSKRFYGVQPMNAYARSFWSGKALLMSEWQYVNQLYVLASGCGVPSKIGRTLSKVVPTKAEWPLYEPNNG